MERSNRHIPRPATSGGAPTDIALWPTTNPKATRPERVLLRSPKGAQLWCPVLSPNSRWLLFTLLLSGEDRVGLSLELTVAPTAGAPPETWTRIAPGHSWPDKPRWARDGKWIFFISKGSTSYSTSGRSPLIRTEASRLASLFRSRTSIHPVGSSRQISSRIGTSRSSCGA